MENKRFIRRQARANQRKLDITLRQLTNGLLTAEQRHTIIHRLNIKKQYRLRLCVKPIRISDLTAVIDQSGTLQILLGEPTCGPASMRLLLPGEVQHNNRRR